jgi:hypothetical protein
MRGEYKEWKVFMVKMVNKIQDKSVQPKKSAHKWVQDDQRFDQNNHMVEFDLECFVCGGNI